MPRRFFRRGTFLLYGGPEGPTFCVKLSIMQTQTLKEGDWSTFIQKEVLHFLEESGLMTRSQNKSWMTSGAKIFALVGDLGAGKTTFSKFFLHTLGVTQHIQSPTFSIINSYNITRSQNKSGMMSDDFEKVFHMDVYRIESIKELEVLHIDEIFNNPKNIIVIEWADKIKSIIPKDALWMNFEHDTIETRKVTINYEIPE